MLQKLEKQDENYTSFYSRPKSNITLLCSLVELYRLSYP